jgi:hypothetical protein
MRETHAALCGALGFVFLSAYMASADTAVNASAMIYAEAAAAAAVPYSTSEAAQFSSNTSTGPHSIGSSISTGAVVAPPPPPSSDPSYAPRTYPSFAAPPFTAVTHGQAPAYFAVCTSVKNVNADIREWVHYYHWLGATAIYIYDHGSTRYAPSRHGGCICFARLRNKQHRGIVSFQLHCKLTLSCVRT